MFDFIKKYFEKIDSQDEINYKGIPEENKQEENNLDEDISLKDMISKDIDSLELDFEIKDVEEPKYILKEDVEIMAQQTLPFPCDHVNYLQQSILKVRKDLVTDPDAVSSYINLASCEEFKVMEEAFTYQVEVNDPCGGPGTITGETLLKEVILVAQINYSVLLFESITRSKVYDGDIDTKTVFCLYKIVPFDEEVIVDKNDFEPVFETTLTRLPELDGVDYYMYKVDGTVRTEEKQP